MRPDYYIEQVNQTESHDIEKLTDLFRAIAADSSNSTWESGDMLMLTSLIVKKIQKGIQQVRGHEYQHLLVLKDESP